MADVYYSLSTLNSTKWCGKINAAYQGMGKTVEGIALLAAIILAFASRDSVVEAETLEAHQGPENDAADPRGRHNTSQAILTLSLCLREPGGGGLSNYQASAATFASCGLAQHVAGG